MNALVKYDAARYALQQAVQVDEVKDIRDKAQAMAAYAKQAKDTELVQWATEIKVRAERRAGQMLAEMDLKPGVKPISNTMLPINTLEGIGISKSQSSRWQKLAAVPDDQFEQAVTAAKEVAGEVTTAAMLRIERANKDANAPSRPQKKEPLPPEPIPEELEHPKYSELDAAHDQIAELQDMLAIQHAPEDFKGMAQETIESLRAENKQLKINLAAVTSARDSLMRENAELKKQILYLQKQAKK